MPPFSDYEVFILEITHGFIADIVTTLLYYIKDG